MSAPTAAPKAAPASRADAYRALRAAIDARTHGAARVHLRRAALYAYGAACARAHGYERACGAAGMRCADAVDAAVWSGLRSDACGLAIACGHLCRGRLDLVWVTLAAVGAARMQ